MFSLIGTTYGGDGRTTTALPNLQGRAPMHPGRGPGLTQRRLGERGGVYQVTLTEAQLPSHTHTLSGSSEDGRFATPQNMYLATGTTMYTSEAPNTTLNGDSLPPAGGSQAHDNKQPYLTVNFIIALVGLYPSRS